MQTPGEMPPAATGMKTLLYVEDNPANQTLMESVMETRRGIELKIASSAEAGIEMALKAPPDLILMDVNLPGNDGVTAVRRLRDHPATRKIPVVAVSGNAMPHDIKKGLAAGFDQYLVKPYDIIELIQTIDRLIRSKNVS